MNTFVTDREKESFLVDWMIHYIQEKYEKTGADPSQRGLAFLRSILSGLKGGEISKIAGASATHRKIANEALS